MHSKHLVMICDHGLDPRLERKLRWLIPHFKETTVFVDNSRPVTDKAHSDQSIHYEPYESAGDLIKAIDGQVLYLAGNRVLLDYFGSIWRSSHKNTVFWEIADLPLRANPFANVLTAALFYGMLFLINPHFLVTAPGFMRWLPKRHPWLVVENVPDLDLCNKLMSLPPARIPGHGPVKIGFPGAIRYFRQLKKLTDFATKYPGEIEIHIWGGPETAWQDFCVFANISAEANLNIRYHGPYRMIDAGPEIYSAIDIVWAVYDNSQLNVRIALPNRMYEAVLSGRWLLVADNTYLSKKVNDMGVGYSIQIDGSMESSFDESLLEILEQFPHREYAQSARDAIRATTIRAEDEFIHFIQTTIKVPA